MEFIHAIFNAIGDGTWGWSLIPFLVVLGCFFTLASGLVQFRFFGRMFRVLFPGGQPEAGGHVSSREALLVSVGGRVGGGNIAGVAVAITLGGPGRCVLDVDDRADRHGDQSVRMLAGPALQAHGRERHLSRRPGPIHPSRSRQAVQLAGNDLRGLFDRGLRAGLQRLPGQHRGRRGPGQPGHRPALDRCSGSRS